MNNCLNFNIFDFTQLFKMYILTFKKINRSEKKKKKKKKKKSD